MEPKVFFCPPDFFFDPVNDTCTKDYQCPLPPKPVPICTCPGLLPDPSDSNAYYFCEPKSATPNIHPYHAYCRYNTVFDEEKHMCVCNNGSNLDSCNQPPNNTISGDCIDPDNLRVKPLNLSSPCPKQKGNYADSKSCSRYFTCEEDDCGNFIKRPAYCAPTTFFDPVTRVCTSGNLKCLCTSEVVDYKCESEGFFKDPECPAAYYACLGYIDIVYHAQHFYCQAGSKFDAGLLACIAVNCDSSSESVSSNSFSFPSSSSSHSLSSPRSSSSSSSSSSYSNENDILCLNKKRYSVHGNHKKYYYCKNNNLIQLNCGKNRYFDSKSAKCLHISKYKRHSSLINKDKLKVKLNIF